MEVNKFFRIASTAIDQEDGQLLGELLRFRKGFNASQLAAEVQNGVCVCCGICVFVFHTAVK